jgi:hypothetical protein
MPLSEPKVVRESLHHRNITVRGYRRADGLFDIEGHLHDTKDVDFRVASGLRKAGEPIHSMWLRITIDKTLTIVDADADTDAMPYVGYCNTITPDYKKLIGLAIRPGFSNKVKELLGGVKGCTHITELIGSLATTAFQTMAGQGVQDPDKKPFQLDRCHALDAAAPAVQRFYPRWYRGSGEVPDQTGSEDH